MMNPEGAHQHEALITRGPVMKSDNSDLVFSVANVVLRHDVCPPIEIEVFNPETREHELKQITFKHEGGTGGDLVFERCARHLVRWEGYDAVKGWLVHMASEFPIIGTQAMKRFDNLALDMDSALLDEYEVNRQSRLDEDDYA